MMQQVVNHPLGGTEYRLPAEVPVDLLPRAGATRILLSSTPEEALQWYGRYYKGNTDSVKRLVDSISKFAPTAAVSFDGHWFIRCCKGDVEDYSFGNNLYLAERQNFDVLRELMGDFEFSHTSYTDFLRLFAGLREDIPPMSGDFLYDEFTLFCDNRWSENLEEDEYEEWLDALCFYSARNGDLLLLNEEGPTGWFFHEENRIEIYSSTFNEFVERFASFIDTTDRPFDAYSAFESR